MKGKAVKNQFAIKKKKPIIMIKEERYMGCLRYLYGPEVINFLGLGGVFAKTGAQFFLRFMCAEKNKEYPRKTRGKYNY